MASSIVPQARVPRFPLPPLAIHQQAVRHPLVRLCSLPLSHLMDAAKIQAEADVCGECTQYSPHPLPCVLQCQSPWLLWLTPTPWIDDVSNWPATKHPESCTHPLKPSSPCGTHICAPVHWHTWARCSISNNESPRTDYQTCWGLPT